MGDVLTDPDSGDEFRVIGQADGRWVLSDSSGSSPAFKADGETLARLGADVNEPPADLADGSDRLALARFGARVVAAGRASSGWGDLADVHAEADAMRRAASHFDSGD
ncbi:hypothetical protein [Patulibacter sp.]|uniref:hypothetical protein n=1 Tax=Patulibacter sp. TaxID=1912859 RepID=UPI00271B0ECA|nr:hypothetical protein [Patulibacter sp.]MDO9409684.1 hypothetical protein [Patulibacter sp.]